MAILSYYKSLWKPTYDLSGDLTTDERDDYIKSVLCLMSAPSKLSATQFPGAKTRYDDFVVVHMNMTPSVHGTVSGPTEIDAFDLIE
jgi:hypothetical protein